MFACPRHWWRHFGLNVKFLFRSSSSATSSSAKESCVVLHPSPIPSRKDRRLLDELYHTKLTINDTYNTQHLLEEAAALAETLGFEVAHKEIVKIRTINPKTYIGRGKISEIRGIASYANACSVFLNVPSLSALQQKSLADLLQVPSVKDRMTVILDIFAQRARTTEAKLQVKLAQYRYALSHLIKSGMTYDQQRGGLGKIGGGGEKALELRRRTLRNHIKVLQEKLRVVKKRREEQRKNRTQPTIGLIGYTNVGKSSLLNVLTGTTSVSVVDRVFETLDTTTRSLYLPSLDTSCLLVDTVGFISQLPHDLVAAFRATLEEVISADLLLHVRDASTIGRGSAGLFEAQKASVNQVLHEIGTPQHLNANPVEVWNKIDRLQDMEEDVPAVLEEYDRRLREARDAGSEVVAISARSGEGLKELTRSIADRLVASGVLMRPPAAAAVSPSTSSLPEVEIEEEAITNQ